MILNRRWIAGGGAVAGIVVVGAILTAAAADREGRLPEGLHVGTIPVGGLEVDAAAVRVRREAKTPLRIRLEIPGERPLVIAASTLQPVPDVADALREEASGRGWSVRLRDVLLPRGRRSLPLRFILDRRASDALLREVTRRTARRPSSAEILGERGMWRVRPSRRGRTVDEVRFQQLLSRMPSVIVIPVRATDPGVTTADAQRVARRAARITDAPVVVEVGGLQGKLTPVDLRQIVRSETAGSRLMLVVDRAGLAVALRRTFPGLSRPAKDAAFSARDGAVFVRPSQPGREVDVRGVASSLLRLGASRVIRAGLREIEADFTSEDASRLGIREQVASFHTPYECCPPRVTNIRRAAAILNGLVIRPGASFSLNAALGERTEERGFVPAPQINAGRLEDAVGGGVSQIATTLFNAAFFAGLRLDRFRPHEFWIPRYPPGREATISWGGPELVVTNDWPVGVLVAVRAGRRGVTVRLYSSRLRRRVATTSSHPDGAAGAFSVTVTRKVWVGPRLRRSEVYRWSYRAPPSRG